MCKEMKEVLKISMKIYFKKSSAAETINKTHAYLSLSLSHSWFKKIYLPISFALYQICFIAERRAVSILW